MATLAVPIPVTASSTRWALLASISNTPAASRLTILPPLVMLTAVPSATTCDNETLPKAALTTTSCAVSTPLSVMVLVAEVTDNKSTVPAVKARAVTEVCAETDNAPPAVTSSCKTTAAPVDDRLTSPAVDRTAALPTMASTVKAPLALKTTFPAATTPAPVPLTTSALSVVVISTSLVLLAWLCVAPSTLKPLLALLTTPKITSPVAPVFTTVAWLTSNQGKTVPVLEVVIKLLTAMGSSGTNKEWDCSISLPATKVSVRGAKALPTTTRPSIEIFSLAFKVKSKSVAR